MKVIHKKTHDYICHECGKQFNWEDGKTFIFGKYEYKTIQERLAIEKHFCSKVCANSFKILDKNNKQ